MDELTFTTYEELMEWLESRKDDKEERYYYGDIECMNGELYTIEDIKHDAEPAWFEGYEDEYGEEHKEACIIYEVLRLYLQDIGYSHSGLEVHHVLAPVAIFVDLEPVGGESGPSLKLCA